MDKNYSISMPSYSVGPNAFEFVAEFCPLYGRKAVVIGGRRAIKAAREKLERAAQKADIEITEWIYYGRECTWEAARGVSAKEIVRKTDMIFAVGGGKAVDTAKLVSILSRKPFFSFPTIASNCAASSALSIVYNNNGTFSEFVYLDHPAKHVFIDTSIIAESPYEYMWAGIGDTYAKYYEVTISARKDMLPGYVAMGVNISRMCLDSLLEHAEQAIRDNRWTRASNAIEEVAVTIIVTTGWVSMLVSRDHTMDYNGGMAHAFFYGLCNLPRFETTHLHGVVVSFGVLVMLLADGQFEECRKLKQFNRQVGLPTVLSDINVTIQDVEQIVDAIICDEDLTHYPYIVTKELVMSAAEGLLR